MVERLHAGAYKNSGGKPVAASGGITPSGFLLKRVHSFPSKVSGIFLCGMAGNQSPIENGFFVHVQ
jgi:hypothetical protein